MNSFLPEVFKWTACLLISSISGRGKGETRTERVREAEEEGKIDKCIIHKDFISTSRHEQKKERNKKGKVV